jgi:alpha 1,3-glucosidase
LLNSYMNFIFFFCIPPLSSIIDSIKLIDDIASKGRKVVTIVDPHLKRDGSYSVHTEAQAAGVYVQNKDGGEFDGWCWPGSSSYVDFTNPKARSWWADRFKLENYKGSTMDLFTWNDMNEPSVFNGPEVTMKKDTKAIDGQESREWHNLYGFYMQMVSFRRFFFFFAAVLSH